MTKKISTFMRYFALSLVLMMSLFLTSVFPSEASDVAFNLGSDDVPSGGGGVYANGISASHKSGYLVYIVDEYGNRASPDAKLYRSTSLCNLPTGSDIEWRVESRLGGYSVSRADYHSSDIAPWNIAPLRIDGGWYSNEADIRAWMAGDDNHDGVLNIQQFIKGAWSDDLAERWVYEDLILLIEPVYSYQVWYRYEVELDFLYGSPFGDEVTEYNTRYNAPILVGTSKTLAEMSNSFIMSLPREPMMVANFWSSGGPKLTLTYKRSFTASAMASGYARGFCHAEKLATGIGSLPAGVAGNGVLSLSQISGTGVGIFAVTASGILDGVTADLTDDATPTSEYDGTVYTLTATGGSSSSGSGSSATTYFGNGSGNCLSGSLYAENCASGTDAYNLADSMKRGMSYDGDVPPVVFSGTSYDLSVYSSLGIVAGMLTVDPSTFPYVDISSTDASGYSSYLSAIRSGIEPSIDRCYDGRVSGTYDEGTMDCSSVIGGASSNGTYNLEVYGTLTQTNCRASSSSSPTWNVGGYVVDLSSQFAKVYYNYGSASSSSGRTLLEGTDLWRAFDASWRQYVSDLQSSGKLEAYWRSKVDEDKNRVGSVAANNAYLAWLPTHPNPSSTPPVREAGLSDEEWEASEAYMDWLEECEAWQAEVDRIKQEARETAIASYDESSFSCNFATGMSSPVAGISPQKWVFKLYWCSPIMQESYLVDDKIPIDDGPARGRELFDEAWKVLFKLYIENNATLGEDVLQRIIVNLPYADSISTVTGEVTDIPYFLFSKRIPNADFLLPDATSMDMR